jgi:glycosyltransferase involved in cell wall biosynthesis
MTLRGSRMRVLTVANHVGTRGGIARSQLLVSRGLAERGHSVRLLYQSEGNLLGEWGSFADTSRIPCSLPTRSRPLSSTAQFLHALAIGARGGGDIVYVHRYWDVHYAVALGSLLRIPVVCHLRLPPLVSARRLSIAMRRVDRFIAVSKDTAMRWGSTDIDSRRIEVVYNGIDTETFVPGSDDERRSTRAELGVPDEAFLVVYAGRIEPSKGVDVLLEACQLLLSGHPHLHLLVVGSASLQTAESAAATYAEELRAKSRGLTVGWLPVRKDIAPLLQAADVVALPARWPEPFGLIAVEALACGTPIVATAVGGLPEVLTGDLGADLVEPDDPVALAKRLAEHDGWRRNRPELTKLYRKAVLDRFSSDATVEGIERVLLDTVAGRRTRHRGGGGILVASGSSL